MSGGFNEDGYAAAPRALGRVVVSFAVGWEEALRRQGYTTVSEANIEAAMRKEVDDVKALAGLGMQQLTYSPGGGLAERFCWARVNFIPETFRFAEGGLKVTIQVTFQVPFPAWLGGNYGGLKYGSGAGKYGAGKKYGHGALSQACSGLNTSFTVTQNGNAVSVVKMTLSPQSAPATAQNPVIQRIKNGAVVDEVRWVGTLVYGQQLEVDGPKQRIAVSGTDAFADSEYQHPDLLRLEPGANSLKVIMTNSGDAATAFLYFYDVYL
jgi:hypothetical protein